MKTLPKSIPVVIAVFVVYRLYRFYFAGRTKPAKNARVLGTNSKSNNIYHQLVANPTAFHFKHDGIILCFEKVFRSKQQVIHGRRGYYSVADQYALFCIDQELKSLHENSLKDAVALVRSTLNDPKPIMLTHWAETVEGPIQIRYNAYNHVKDQDYDLPAACIAAYEQVATLVKEKIDSGNYTHLILACTGWNNRQDMSLATYSHWLTNNPCRN